MTLEGAIVGCTFDGRLKKLPLRRGLFMGGGDKVIDAKVAQAVTSVDPKKHLEGLGRAAADGARRGALGLPLAAARPPRRGQLDRMDAARRREGVDVRSEGGAALGGNVRAPSGPASRPTA